MKFRLPGRFERRILGALFIVSLLPLIAAAYLMQVTLERVTRITSAHQVSGTGSLIPACASVGTSGSAAERCGVATASARNRPVLMCGTAGAMSANIISICPPRVSFTARIPPL